MKTKSLSKFIIGIIPIILLVFTVRNVSAYDFAFGADLSFLKQAEDRGAVFKDGTNALPGLKIFKNHGYNWVRLRIFVEPLQRNLPNNLTYTLDLAKEAKSLGYKFLLDIHYSTVWADPAHQATPAAWLELSHKQRVQKVFEYSRDTLAAFQAAGVPPDMVQVGNEITDGMLWPDGQLPDHWKNFADYLRAGIRGVKGGCGTNSYPRIMIHIDTGASIAKTKYFFDHLNHYKIPYDVIGLSYYPWWQGSLEDLRENLAFTASTYGKDVMVVEIAYHWKPAHESQARVMPFPETPEGQREFLDEATRIVMQTPDNRGKGIFWWEPAVPPGGGIASRGFFDDNGCALPVMTVFDKITRPVHRTSN